jgi:glycosyltransferase involved in cell wall biosynthesis
MHIGISGPIHLPSLNINYGGDRSSWPKGMGGSPVNSEINALLELGYKVSVFSLSPEIQPGNSFEWLEGNLSIFIGPYRKRARYRCLDFFYKERRYLKNKILEIKPNVIHAHWQYEWGWAALSSGIPTLLTCHDSPLSILKNQKDLYRVFRLIIAFIVLRKAKYLTTVSAYAKDELFFFIKKAIKIIPNFVNDLTFTYYKLRKLESTIKLIMINNGFNGRKNVKLGIQSFNALKLSLPNLELHLYGAGHGKHEDAENWCRKNNILNNVFFHGEIAHNQLMIELSKADILLHTAFEESFGMILIEAMAMGIPVVAGKDSGAVPWVLKDGGGELVDIKSVIEINNGIKKVISNYNVISIEAKNSVMERFSKNMVVSQYLQEMKTVFELSVNKKK